MVSESSEGGSTVKESVHAKNDGKSWAAALLGESLAITAIAALFYFWGMVYYSQLARSLNLDVSLFSIPLNEVLMVPWDGILYLLLVGIGILVVWRARWIIFGIVWILLVIVFSVLGWVYAPLWKTKWVKTAGGSAFGGLDSFFKFLGARTPKKINTKIDEFDFVNGTVKPLAYLFVLMAILWVGVWKEKQAEKEIDQYKEAKERMEAQVICTDGSILTGYWVKAIGDSVVIDIHDSPSPRRTVVRSSNYKQLILLGKKTVEDPKPQPVVPAPPKA